MIDKTISVVRNILMQKRDARKSHLKMMEEEFFDYEIDKRTDALKKLAIEIELLKRIITESK